MSSVGHYLGVSLTGAFALGGTLAMSSTAILLKLLAERNALETEHGRRIIGILLFQDLAVVPLLVVIPALVMNPDEPGAANSAWALAKAAVLLTLIFVGGRWMMRRWFHIWSRGSVRTNCSCSTCC